MINKVFSSILWEYNLDSLNYNDNIVFIRTATIWDKNHCDILKKEIWINHFKQKFLENINSLDKKTINYYTLIFNLTNIKLPNIQSTYDKLNSPIFTRNFG